MAKEKYKNFERSRQINEPIVWFQLQPTSRSCSLSFTRSFSFFMNVFKNCFFCACLKTFTDPCLSEMGNFGALVSLSELGWNSLVSMASLPRYMIQGTYEQPWLPFSVTIFGEISPLWQKFTNLWQFFDSLFLNCQNAESTLGKFVTILR